MGRKPVEVTAFDQALSKEIQDRMADKSLSLRSLAAEVGMSASRMSYCLNGERAFTVGEVERISAVLGVSHWRLIKAADDVLKEERARRADVIAFPGGPSHISDGMTDQEALEPHGRKPAPSCS